MRLWPVKAVPPFPVYDASIAVGSILDLVAELREHQVQLELRYELEQPDLRLKILITDDR